MTNEKNDCVNIVSVFKYFLEDDNTHFNLACALAVGTHFMCHCIASIKKSVSITYPTEDHQLTVERRCLLPMAGSIPG